MLLFAWMLSGFSCVRLFATRWTVACQASLSSGFFLRQEYWSGSPWPTPGDLPAPGIDPVSLTSALAGRFFTTSITWEAPPRDGTLVSCVAGTFLTVWWTTREAQALFYSLSWPLAHFWNVANRLFCLVDVC